MLEATIPWAFDELLTIHPYSSKIWSTMIHSCDFLGQKKQLGVQSSHHLPSSPTLMDCPGHELEMIGWSSGSHLLIFSLEEPTNHDQSSSDNFNDCKIMSKKKCLIVRGQDFLRDIFLCHFPCQAMVEEEVPDAVRCRPENQQMAGSLLVGGAGSLICETERLPLTQHL